MKRRALKHRYGRSHVRQSTSTRNVVRRLVRAEERLARDPHDFGAVMASANAIGALRKKGFSENEIQRLRGLR
jgi:hypothetical protein